MLWDPKTHTSVSPEASHAARIACSSSSRVIAPPLRFLGLRASLEKDDGHGLAEAGGLLPWVDKPPSQSLKTQPFQQLLPFSQCAGLLGSRASQPFGEFFLRLAHELRLPREHLGSNQDSPDPVPLRLSPPLRPSVRGLDCAFAFTRGTAAVRRCPSSLYTFRPDLRLGSALAVKRPPTLRTFTHTVSGVVSSVSIARVRRVASYTKGQFSFPTHFELHASGTSSATIPPKLPLVTHRRSRDTGERGAKPSICRLSRENRASVPLFLKTDAGICRGETDVAEGRSSACLRSSGGRATQR